MARFGRYGVRYFTDPDYGLGVRGFVRAVPVGGAAYNVADAYNECRFSVERLQMMPLLYSLERLTPQTSIGDATLVIAHLAALQDKYVGAYSLCDLVNARQVVEKVWDQRDGVATHDDRIFRDKRMKVGLNAAKILRWVFTDERGFICVKPVWYDDDSVKKTTARRAAKDCRAGIRGLLEAASV